MASAGACARVALLVLGACMALLLLGASVALLLAVVSCCASACALALVSAGVRASEALVVRERKLLRA